MARLVLPRLALVLAALSAAACTPMRLEHPTFGTSRLDQDAAECDDLARREAMRFMPILPPPRLVRDRRGRAVWVRPSFSEWEMERWHQEREVSRICLASRGYRLVPVEPKP